MFEIETGGNPLNAKAIKEFAKSMIDNEFKKYKFYLYHADICTSPIVAYKIDEGVNEQWDSVTSIETDMRRIIYDELKKQGIAFIYVDEKKSMRNYISAAISSMHVVINSDWNCTVFKNLIFQVDTKANWKRFEVLPKSKSFKVLPYVTYNWNWKRTEFLNENNNKWFKRLTKELFYGNEVYALEFIKMFFIATTDNGVGFWVYSSKNTGKSTFFKPFIDMLERNQIGLKGCFNDITNESKTKSYVRKLCVFDDDASGSGQLIRGNALPILKKQFNNREIQIDVKFKDSIQIKVSWTWLCLGNDVASLGDIPIDDGVFDRIVHLKVKKNFIKDFSSNFVFDEVDFINWIWTKIVDGGRISDFRNIFKNFNFTLNIDSFFAFMYENNSVIKYMELLLSQDEDLGLWTNDDLVRVFYSGRTTYLDFLSKASLLGLKKCNSKIFTMVINTLYVKKIREKRKGLYSDDSNIV